MIHDEFQVEEIIFFYGKMATLSWARIVGVGLKGIAFLTIT